MLVEEKMMVVIVSLFAFCASSPVVVLDRHTCMPSYEGKTIIALDCPWIGPARYTLTEDVGIVTFQRFTNEGSLYVPFDHVNVIVADGLPSVCEVIDNRHGGTVMVAGVVCSELKTATETSPPVQTTETSPPVERMSTETVPPVEGTLIEKTETVSLVERTSTETVPPVERTLIEKTETVSPVEKTLTETVPPVERTETVPVDTTPVKTNVPYLEDWVVPTITVLCESLIMICTTIATCCTLVNRQRHVRLHFEQVLNPALPAPPQHPQPAIPLPDLPGPPQQHQPAIPLPDLPGPPQQPQPAIPLPDLPGPPQQPQPAIPLPDLPGPPQQPQLPLPAFPPPQQPQPAIPLPPQLRRSNRTIKPVQRLNL